MQCSCRALNGWVLRLGPFELENKSALPLSPTQPNIRFTTNESRWIGGNGDAASVRGRKGGVESPNLRSIEPGAVRGSEGEAISIPKNGRRRLRYSSIYVWRNSRLHSRNSELHEQWVTSRPVGLGRVASRSVCDRLRRFRSEVRKWEKKTGYSSQAG